MLESNAVERANERRGTAPRELRSKRGMKERYRPIRRTCPLCGDGVMRVHRRVVDRIYSLFHPIHRYQCTSLECGWQGNMPQRTALNREGLSPLSRPTGSR